MTIKQLSGPFQYSMTALALVCLGAFPAPAQESQPQNTAQHHQEQAHGEQTQDQKRKASALLKIVRDSTERFQDVSVAKSEGYALQFGCVSGPDSGAMGLHYVNADILNRGEVDATHPQIVIYEPRADGSLKLIGADFLVFAEAWNATHTGPPELMGQLFHLFDSPNRFGLPAFYTLHVWAWKDNPNGAFVNWHPDVSCEQFNGDSSN